MWRNCIVETTHARCQFEIGGINFQIIFKTRCLPRGEVGGSRGLVTRELLCVIDGMCHDPNRLAIIRRLTQVHNMLYKFKSKAAGDLIMLEPTGRKVLQAIGKEPGAKGIIEVTQMDNAIAALRDAIAREEADLKEAQIAALAKGEVPPTGPEVSLRQKAVPFIEMLTRCLKEEQPIVWGV